MEKDHISLYQIVASTVELAAPRAHAKGLKLNCSLDISSREDFEFDAWRLQQLVNNLVTNAIMYTENGSIDITIDDVTPADHSETDVIFEIGVRDTGAGIADDVKNIMFATPDERESFGSKNDIGLGLVIAQQLCDIMHGEFQLESAPGEGTHAIVRLPLNKGLSDKGTPILLQQRLFGARALIVDNDVTARRLLEAHLRSWGVGVSSVLDGFSAVDEICAAEEGESWFAMIFVNGSMTESHLLAVLAALKQSSEHSHALTVVTGIEEADDGTMNAELARRSQAILHNPIRPSQLFDCLAQMNTDAAPSIIANNNLDPTANDGRRRILLVEDNIVNQCVASEILKRIGVAVEIANNGLEALQRLEQAGYDFVFMDCQMPEMDGFAATRAIRAQEHLADLPVVALTANALSGDRERCLDAGMSDYLTKPFTKDQLEKMLNKWTQSAPGVSTNSDAVTSRNRAHETANSNRPLIDDAALEQIRMLDDDGESMIFNEILEEYLSSSEELVRNLDRGVQTVDAQVITQAAHALKSSSAAVGAAAFAQQCDLLETMARNSDLGTVNAVWLAAQKAYHGSVSELSTMLQRKVA